MKFVTVRDLRLKAAKVWKQLQKEKEMVITSNGKPIALLMKLELFGGDKKSEDCS